MIDMHSKYDNMHKNGMFYVLICIINRIISCYHSLDLVIVVLISCHIKVNIGLNCSINVIS